MDWKNLFLNFNGRINRAKFWAGVGVLFVASIIFSVLDAILGLQITEGMGILSLIFGIASIYFSLALYAKRWHDRGKSGWWSLIILAPIIGLIWIIVELGCLPGESGENKYGPDPLA